MRLEDKLINKKTTQSNPFGSVEAITEKVNEALRQETQSFFNSSAKCNIKEWKVLREKLKIEKARANAGASVSKPPTDPKAISMKALEDEAYRLEMDYNKNWLLYEKYHLDQAFVSQQNRIESDTHSQMTLLNDEFNKEKSKFSPATAPAQTAPLPAQDPQSPSRWHHAEKQKTLFNTAPVLMASPINKQQTSKDNKPHVRSAHDTKEVRSFLYDPCSTILAMLSLLNDAGFMILNL